MMQVRRETAKKDEWIEEEQVVLVELSGIIDSEYLSRCSSSGLKLLGVETDEPVLQLGNYIYSGQHKNMLGTAVIFENTGKGSNCARQWKYKYHTDKKIEMQRALVKPKNISQEINLPDRDIEAPT